jgi:hypothetical protein
MKTQTKDLKVEKSDTKAESEVEITITGVPLGVVFNRRIPDGLDGLSIAFASEGKVFPASAQYGASDNSMIQDEILSMVHAAIKQGEPITLVGEFANDNIPGLTYPNGSFRFDKLFVFGYSWDKNFLVRAL